MSPWTVSVANHHPMILSSFQHAEPISWGFVSLSPAKGVILLLLLLLLLMSFQLNPCIVWLQFYICIHLYCHEEKTYVYIYIILILKASSDLFAVKTRGHLIHTTRWWFQIFFIFTPIWGRFPIWLYNNGLKPPTSSEWYTSCLAKKGHLQWQQRIIRLPSKHLKTPCCCIFPLNQPPKKRQKRCGVRGCCCLRHSVGGTFVLGDVDVDGFFGNLQMNLGGS